MNDGKRIMIIMIVNSRGLRLTPLPVVDVVVVGKKAKQKQMRNN